ncbi:MAG: hypothetical protein AAF899_09500 [Pseudomonadota bacterium]
MTIVDISRFSATPPSPTTSRDAIASVSVVAVASSAPPTSISARPTMTIRASPKRAPSAPIGSTIAIPGRR